MKEYILIKCDKLISLYDKDSIIKVELDNNRIIVYWTDHCGHLKEDEYYPTNVLQLFNKIVKDLRVGEDKKQDKEI